MGTVYAIRNDFGDRLRELRGEMSLRDASQITGISHTYIRDLELGKKAEPSEDTLKRLATAYKVPISVLVQDQDFKHELVQELTKQLGEKNTEIRKLNFFVDSLAIALSLAVKELQELRKQNG